MGEESSVEEIEITQGMVQAGVRSYLSWDHQEDDPREIVEEIFLAMEQMSAKPVPKVAKNKKEESRMIRLCPRCLEDDEGIYGTLFFVRENVAGCEFHGEIQFSEVFCSKVDF